jgi:hypothetical protein
MKMPSEEELPPSIADIVYHNAAKVRQHDPDFDNDMIRLINDLKEHLQ